MNKAKKKENFSSFLLLLVSHMRRNVSHLCKLRSNPLNFFLFPLCKLLDLSFYGGCVSLNEQSKEEGEFEVGSSFLLLLVSHIRRNVSHLCKLRSSHLDLFLFPLCKFLKLYFCLLKMAHASESKHTKKEEEEEVYENDSKNSPKMQRITPLPSSHSLPTPLPFLLNGATHVCDEGRRGGGGVRVTMSYPK
jgi:hypothetical protein